MKIVVSQNKAGIDDIRNSIIKQEDLVQFDNFLNKYPTIDPKSNEMQEESSACCGGDNCCQNITVEVKNEVNTK